MTEIAFSTEPEVDVSLTKLCTNGYEQRGYSLNREKSMKKKLQDTNRPDEIEITHTGGGVRLFVNSGAFELLRIASDQFFSSETDGGMVYTKTSVHDNQGHLVETRYKAKHGKTAYYTLNMYNTKSSCLVNGKMLSYFMETDFQKIMDLIEHGVACENTTIGVVNDKIKEWILKYYKSADIEVDVSNVRASKTNHVSPVNKLCAPDNEYDCLPSKEVNSNRLIDSTTETNTISMKPSTDTTSTDTDTEEVTPNLQYSEQKDIQMTEDEAPVVSILNRIQDEIGEIKTELKSHIETSQTQFGRIQDELFSIKKSISLNDNVAQNNMEILTGSTDNVNSEVQKTSETVQRRLSAIFDSLKSLHRKSVRNEQTTSCDDSIQIIDSVQSLKPTNREVVSNSTTRESLPEQSDLQQHKAPEKQQNTKTLIIGSSILKDINTKGLDPDISISTNRGAGIKQIVQKVNLIEVKQYKNVIVYIGGNNMSDGMQIQEIHEEYAKLICVLKEKECNVHLCTVCPRQDTEVIPLNDVIKQLSTCYGVNYVDCYSPFIYGDGQPVRQNFSKDLIHLSQKGTSALLRAIHKHLPVLRLNRSLNQQSREHGNQYSSREALNPQRRENSYQYNMEQMFNQQGRDYDHQYILEQPYNQQGSDHAYQCKHGRAFNQQGRDHDYLYRPERERVFNQHEHAYQYKSGRAFNQRERDHDEYKTGRAFNKQGRDHDHQYNPRGALNHEGRYHDHHYKPGRAFNNQERDHDYRYKSGRAFKQPGRDHDCQYESGRAFNKQERDHDYRYKSGRAFNKQGRDHVDQYQPERAFNQQGRDRDEQYNESRIRYLC